MRPWSHGAARCIAFRGMAVEVRPARAGRAGRRSPPLLRAAGLGANVGRLLEFPRSSPSGEVLRRRAPRRDRRRRGGRGLRRDGLDRRARRRRRGAPARRRDGADRGARPTGCASTARRPSCSTRRRRAARSTSASASSARARRTRGATSPRPPLGRAAGRASARSAPPTAPTVRALDAAATGEDRGAVFDALGRSATARGWSSSATGASGGQRAALALGPRAERRRRRTPTPASRCFSALRRAPRLAADGLAARRQRGRVRALRAWGLRPINQATRMRLGPRARLRSGARVRHVQPLLGMTWEPELDELRRRARARAPRWAARSASRASTPRAGSRCASASSACSTPARSTRPARWRAPATLRRRRRARGLPARRTWSSARAGSTAAARSSQGDDFTVRGGAADAAIWQKMVWAERAAHDLRLPLVRLVDGTGGGGSVKSLETMGFTYVPHVPGLRARWSRTSPRCRSSPPRSGPCAGLGAARVVASALQRDRARHRAALRRRPAGRGQAGDGRDARQGGARRRARRRPRRARSTTRPPTRTTRSRRSGASSPTCPTTSGSRRRSPRADRPRRPPRGGAALRSSRATPRKPYKMRRDPRGGARPRLGLRARRAATGRSLITALARLDGRPGRRARRATRSTTAAG